MGIAVCRTLRLLVCCVVFVALGACGGGSGGDKTVWGKFVWGEKNWNP